MFAPLIPETPKIGERCFAILLYRVPKRSTWRPRFLDALPAVVDPERHTIAWPSHDLAHTVADCREHNARAIFRASLGSRVTCWAVPVEMWCGYDATAVVVDAAGKAVGHDN